MDLTIVELHLHDAEFNAPFSDRGTSAGPGDGSAEPDDASGEGEEDEEEATASALLGLVVVLALLGVAALARALRQSTAAE